MKPQLVVALLSFVVHASAWAQLLAPFTAAEGASAAIRTATQSGISNVATDAIYTTGDTSLLANLGGGIGSTVTLAFDFQRGTNTVWIYSISGKASSGTDTTLLYAVVKVVALYQAFPLFGVPGLDQLGQLRGEQALPASFMNSNIMVQKLAADSVFRTFRQLHPRSILLGASLASVRSSPTSSPQPLWSVQIGEGTLLRPTSAVLTCFVPATDTSGTARCIEVPLASAESSLFPSQLEIFPNPISGDMAAVRLPVDALSSQATLRIYSLDGRTLAEYQLSNLAAGQAIAVPVSSLGAGIYMLHYRTAQTVRIAPLVVTR
ncbi:hypothetical protein HRbin20_00983 [bacterium HR20]|nr:hypothetical protein HRbin20_00983 [bacterium HR20]